MTTDADKEAIKKEKQRTYNKKVWAENSEKIKAKYRENFEKRKAYNQSTYEKRKEYYRANKEKILAQNKAWMAANKDIRKEQSKARYISDPEKNKLASRAYKKANPEKIRNKKRAAQSKRRCAQLKRTPAWADLNAIADFYKNCPEGYTVDHIIPLQGKYVSGLHVLNNLQYLTGSENSAKGNRYPI